jgi:uncharacterized protein YjiS (DUF1127 family)
MTILTLLRPLGAAAAVCGMGEKSAIGWINRCRRTIAGWITRSRTRIALRDIADDDHLLKDIGVSRDDALREANKPFWSS